MVLMISLDSDEYRMRLLQTWKYLGEINSGIQRYANNILVCLVIKILPTQRNGQNSIWWNYSWLAKIVISQNSYEDDRPIYTKKLKVDSFGADKTEVTLVQFKSFVEANGYITDAEKQNGVAVLTVPTNSNTPMLSWWTFEKDISWNKIHQKMYAFNEPIPYVTYNDALAYASLDVIYQISWKMSI